MDQPITLTRDDFERLTELVRQHESGPLQYVAEQLQTELERARLVSPNEIPADVVTMNSTVAFEDQDGARREVDLVYPEDATTGRVSVLSPLGAALLGLAVGSTIEWPMPDGATATLKVIRIGYQPEDAGDFHL